MALKLEDIKTDKPVHERRYRWFVLPQQELIPMLRGELETTNLPEGTRIVGVQYELIRQGFMVLIEHPTFDDVPPAVECPAFPLQLRTRRRT